MSGNDSPTPASIPIGIPLSTSRKRRSKGTENEDSIVILNALLNFKAQHGGRNPTPATIGPLLDAVQQSLHNQLTADQLYNRLRSLKNKYLRASSIAGGPGPTEFDRTFFDLAVRAWGVRSARVEEEKAKVTVAQNGNDDDDAEDDDEIMNEDEDGDADHDLEGGDEDMDEDEDEDEDEGEEEEVEEQDEDFESICERYKYLARGVKEVWKREGLSLTTLKLGMKNMNKKKAEKLDKKWKLHFMKGLEIEARSLSVQHQLVEALAAHGQ